MSKRKPLRREDDPEKSWDAYWRHHSMPTGPDAPDILDIPMPIQFNHSKFPINNRWPDR